MRGTDAELCSRKLKGIFSCDLWLSLHGSIASVQLRQCHQCLINWISNFMSLEWNAIPSRRDRLHRQAKGIRRPPKFAWEPATCSNKSVYRGPLLPPSIKIQFGNLIAWITNQFFFLRRKIVLSEAIERTKPPAKIVKLRAGSQKNSENLQLGHFTILEATQFSTTPIKSENEPEACHRQERAKLLSSPIINHS